MPSRSDDANRQLEIDAAEIRIRAERRLGELLIEQKATVGLATGVRMAGRDAIGGAVVEPPKDNRPTLADIGVDKKLSSHAQKVAAIPKAEFEGIVGQWRDFSREGVNAPLKGASPPVGV